MVTWKTYEATRAFERARKGAFARLARAFITARKRGLPYSGILPKQEFTARIDDIEMLEVEGSAIKRPALPISQKSAWIKEYEEYGKVERCFEPFSARIEGGRLVLEGGIPELRRLELQKSFGESYVVARMGARLERLADLIEYPRRPDATCCSDRAAS